MSESIDSASKYSEKKRILLNLLLQREKNKNISRLRISALPRDSAAFPLSFAQQRLWFLDQMEVGNPFYNLSTSIRFSGRLSLQGLEQTLSEIIARHEVLRTVFAIENDQPAQIIKPAEPISLPVMDLSELTQDEAEKALRRATLEESRHPFDLSQYPLLRVKVVRLEEQEHIILLTMHHIISDAWSMGVLIEEVGKLYIGFCNEETSSLNKLEIQYADYAVWQREWMEGEAAAAQLDYWKQQLSEAPSMLELPLDRPRSAAQTFNGARYPVRMPKSVADSLSLMSQREGGTLFMTLLAAFNLLLSRYSGQQDIVVGTPIANRNRSETERLIGIFINTLALRTRLNKELTFADLVRSVKETALGAYAHQDLPFEKIVEEVRPERAASHSPLFQVMFALQNAPTKVLDLQDLRLSAESVDNETSMFDLALALEETHEGLNGMAQYNTDLFDQLTISRMMLNFNTLVESAIKNPDSPIFDLPLLNDPERLQLLVEWNDTGIDLERAICVHKLFEEAAYRNPQALAVTCKHQHISYGELNARANQLANYLQKRNIGPEAIVGILFERSIEMVVAILATLKAGGAYLPLDPSYPGERLAHMLKDAGVPMLLTQERLRASVPQSEIITLCLDSDSEAFAAESINSPAASVEASNLAYVIYTSGSTGKPKGVELQHTGLLNLITWHQRVYEVSEADRASLVAGSAFDASVWELWPYLTAGASLHIPDDDTRINPRGLLDWIAAEAITICFIPTPLASAMLNEPARANIALRYMLTGGDKLNQRGREPLPFALINHYGPTENTVVATYAPVEIEAHNAAAPPIGRPIFNTQAYLLDRDFRLLPVGVTGELCIAGIGLARDYLGMPDKTAEKFTPNPYSAAPGMRMYATGDLARYLPDGNIEFLGRADHQIKIRGFRIELAEIEAVLNDHPAVEEAIVIVKEKGIGNKLLVAYIVLRQLQQGTTKELRRYLRERLPEYMVPTDYIMIEAMPLTRNGKIDRKALPDPQLDQHEETIKAYTLPHNTTEEVLLGIWQGLLNCERISVHDNFFELGGHSLLATQMMSKVRETFYVEMGVRKLFEWPTLAEFAQQIELAQLKGKGIEGARLVRAERKPRMAVSYAQQRLWFLDQLEPGSAFYNIPAAVRLKGSLDEEALRKTISEVVRRHEVLRTAFGSEAGEPVQVIEGAKGVEVEVVELRDIEDEQEKQEQSRRIVREEGSRGFDLATGPMMRVKLIRMSEQDHVLVITMHHIVSDGWSMGVMIREVAALYEAYLAGKESPLEELEVQYADYAVWQREWLEGEVLDRQMEYWSKQLEGAAGLIQLPTDRPRPSAQSYKGDTETAYFSCDLLNGLNRLGRREQATLFMILLAGFKALLYRYSGQQDIIVGSDIANRNRGETEELIGFFVNQLVLRTQLSAEMTFNQLAAKVRETALMAYANQDVPFEQIVQKVQPERDLSRSPLFQTKLILQNMPRHDLQLPGLELTRLEVQSNVSRFDLTMSVAEVENELIVTAEYSTELFDQSTIKRMLGHLQVLLESAIAEPQQRLDCMDLLTQSEREQLAVLYGKTDMPRASTRFAHEMFEACVECAPDAVAISLGELELTYREINYRANHLGHYLKDAGVMADVPVGICLDKSVELIIALLATHKAGGICVLLDPESPLDLMSFMVESAQPPVILTQDSLVDKLPSYWGMVLCLDTEWSIIGGQCRNNVTSIITQDSLAYITCASTSTDRPNAVMINHAALSRQIESLVKEYRLDATDRLLPFTPLTSAAPSEEIYTALASGASLVIEEDCWQKTIEELLQECDQKTVTTLQVTPAHFYELLGEMERVNRLVPSSVKLLITRAENLRVENLARWTRRTRQATRFLNAYGPCESRLVSTLYDAEIKVGAVPQKVSIGKPVSDTQVYVLDGRQNPVPVGVIGELHIAGGGLARGYLNQADLTAEKFAPNAYSNKEGTRLRKTGDLGRRLSDGNIELLGSVDHQANVRWYRLDCAEVESALRQYQGVKDAVVVAIEGKTPTAQLVAYITGRQSDEIGKAQLRRYLRERLPEYMVPTDYIMIEAMPLTRNGKIDRKALPDPQLDQHEEAIKAYTLPHNTTEEVLLGIWQGLLNCERISVHDNFFELGGHSLLATQMMSKVRETFYVEIGVRKLFEWPTLAEFAQQIELAQLKGKGIEGARLVRAERKPRMAVSYAQQRLWFLDQLEPGSAFYNIPAAVRLKGSLDEEALRKTISEVVRRHEVLRTAFGSEAGEPVQVIEGAKGVEVEVVELRDIEDEQEKQEQSRRIVREEGSRGFDLATGPMMRVKLIRMSEQDHVLVITMHHIVSDGWSMGVMIREVAALYEAYLAGKESPLEELEVQYADYAVWQREWLEGEVLDRQMEYWSKQLEGAAGLIQLPTDRPRPAVQSYRGKSLSKVFDRQLQEELKEASRREGVTLFMTMMGVFQEMMGRYSGSEDVVVGTDVANRNRAEVEGLIGFFVNQLVIRTDLRGRPSYRELMRRVREVALGAYAHQDMPFEKLVEAINPNRSLQYSPIFQVSFTLQNAPIEEIKIPGLTLSVEREETEVAKYEITMSVAESEEGMGVSVEYSTDLYDESTIERMVNHYRELLKGAVSQPERSIRDLEMLSADEKNQLLYEWNSAVNESWLGLSFNDAFAAQVERTPDALALSSSAGQITYRQLNDSGRNVARYLKSKGVGAEDVVAIVTQRGIGLVAAILGVWKATAAYLPVDPNHPLKRQHNLLKQSGVKVVLAAAEYEQGMREAMRAEEELEGVEVASIEEVMEGRWQQESGAETEVAEQTAGAAIVEEGKRLAYVIYTSGSTGEPKGAMVEQEGMINHLMAKVVELEMSDRDKVAQTASQCFDISVWQIWAGLLVGGQVHIFEDEVAHDPQELVKQASKQQITIMEVVPTMLQEMMEQGEKGKRGLDNLRWMIATGEALGAHTSRRWQKQYAGVKLMNAYGPTECSDDVTHHKVESEIKEWEVRTPIGKAIGNMRMHVLDEGMREVGVGIEGELYVGGVGVGRGYYKDAGRTAQAYVPEEGAGEAGARMYRTGDRVKRKQGGELEYQGRRDGQIKLRGYRIEIGEIEEVMRRERGVREVVVMMEQRGKEKRLVAYVEMEEGRMEEKEMKRRLKQRLPEYMVPSRYEEVERIAKTSNGKIDRKEMERRSRERKEEQEEEEVSRESRREMNEQEEVIAGIWEEVMGERVEGAEEEFFEKGGHSLLATQVVSRMRDAFKIEIPLRVIFEAPTVAGLAQKVNEARMAKYGLSAPPIRALSMQENLPLSFAQQRLWFMEQLEPGNSSYHVPIAVRIKGDLDAQALRLTLKEVVRRQAALRTTFTLIDGYPRQVIHPAESVNLLTIDLRGLEEIEREAETRRLASEEAKLPFDLSKGPLLRSSLIQTGEIDYSLLLTMHHIVSDAWSIGLLIEEMATLYAAFSEGKESPLEELPVQYADYAVWQRNWLQGDVLNTHIEYWRRKLSGKVPTLELPTDRPRPAVNSFRGNRHGFSLPAFLSESIKDLSRRESATLFMTLLAAFKTLLYRYTNEDDIIVGAAIANRTRSETERVIGFFVNMLALRTNLSDNPSFRELLARVREVALDAYAHQDLPFDKVVEEVQADRQAGSTPLFQVAFGLQNAPMRPLKVSGIEISPLPIDYEVSRYDLTLWMAEDVEGLGAYWTYSTDLFDHSTIVRMSEHFETILRNIVANPDAQLDQLEYRTEIEKEQKMLKAKSAKQSSFDKLKKLKPQPVVLTKS